MMSLNIRSPHTYAFFLFVLPLATAWRGPVGDVSSDVRVLECEGMTSVEGMSQRTHISSSQRSPSGLSHTQYLH